MVLDNQAAPSTGSSVGHRVVVQDTGDSWLARALAFCSASDTVDIPGPVVDFLGSSKDKADTRCSSYLCSNRCYQDTLDSPNCRRNSPDDIPRPARLELGVH